MPEAESCALLADPLTSKIPKPACDLSLSELSFSQASVLFCPSCGFTEAYPENEPLICPSCRRPAEPRLFVRIRDLSGNHGGKRLLLKGRIVGEGETKSIVYRVKARCHICGLEVELDLGAPSLRSFLETLIFSKKGGLERVLASALPRGACKARDGHSWGFETLGMLDFREVRVQDLFEFEEAQDREAETRAIGGILLDRSGYKAGLLDSETLIAPDNRVMLIIHRIFPSDLMEGELKAEDYEEIKRLFQGKDLKDLEGIIDRIVAPEIKGRGKAKLAAALTALSPRWFRISQYGAIPGCLRCLFFGDPRTGKGAILRWFSKKGIAGHAVGETAARTGLIYSIDPELRILSWGILPLNDGRMVVLEGLHGLSAEEMERFREVLAQQRVEVHRVVRGAAWCRTRLLADVNPNQPSLASNYPCVCLALLDCKPFYRPTDLTRWDLFIPFKREDVSPNEMYGDEGLPSSSSVKQEEKAYLSLVEWAWSRGTEDIRVDEGALKEAKLQFEALLNEFGSEALPIVHNASFWTILRLSIAVAALEFSSQDNRNLLVEAKHVKEASAFFKESLEALELREAKAIYEEEPLSKEEAERLKEGLSNQGELSELFREIVVRPGDVSELAGRLGTSEITIKRRAGELKGLGLIRRGRRGYEATKKGVALFRMIQLIPMIPIPGFQRNDFYQKGTGEKTSIKSINCITTIPPDSDNKKDEPGLLPHTQKACEVCGSHGSFSIVREGGVHYLCGKCLGEWKGPL